MHELSGDGKVIRKKANISRLKVYTKRAAEDDVHSTNPSTKKNKVHNIGIMK